MALYHPEEEKATPEARTLATKRLQKEVQDVMMQQDSLVGVCAFPDDGDLFRWLGTLDGPEDTPYSGTEFSIELRFSASFPMTPPRVKFLTRCFHPNVALRDGDVCLDTLQDNWSASLGVPALLLSMQALLASPNPASPLNVEAAALWEQKAPEAREDYRRRVVSYATGA